MLLMNCLVRNPAKKPSTARTTIEIKVRFIGDPSDTSDMAGR
jgi:hypothetical protein